MASHHDVDEVEIKKEISVEVRLKARQREAEENGDVLDMTSNSDEAAPPSVVDWGRIRQAATAALLIPPLLMAGKRKHHGKNKRRIKPQNHGARPCNQTGRRARRPKSFRPRGSE